MQVDISLKANLDRVTVMLGHNVDLVTRNFLLGETEAFQAVVFYLDNMINPGILDSEIMKPLLDHRYQENSGPKLLKLLLSGGLISRAQISEADNFQDIISYLLRGEVVLFIEGYSRAFIISCKGYEFRSVSDPTIENAVRGPRDAFIEALTVNISLIRRRLVTPNLVVENKKIGRISSTNVAVVYLKGIAPKQLLDEVRCRLDGIDIDAVLESSYIEHLIQDHPYSPFPQIGITERPDRVVGGLLEGRVAIIIDNSPFVLILPGELTSLLDSPEDYYNRFYYATAVRWLRYISFL
ncbi:hypothetical protein N752_15555 [Desulforamulus aquiferis]|nr:hypothetical protein N752_15555 [Desulforamulus aquiferis]